MPGTGATGSCRPSPTGWSRPGRIFDRRPSAETLALRRQRSQPTGSGTQARWAPRRREWNRHTPARAGRVEQRACPREPGTARRSAPAAGTRPVARASYRPPRARRRLGVLEDHAPGHRAGSHGSTAGKDARRYDRVPGARLCRRPTAAALPWPGHGNNPEAAGTRTGGRLGSRWDSANRYPPRLSPPIGDREFPGLSSRARGCG